MKHNDHRTHPPLVHRLFSVWFRHMRVYSRNLISNGLPPFLEPLIFLVGIGMGLGRYIQDMNGVPYLEYLGSGLLVAVAMFTAAFECSFGTFIRLEFDKVYDGMLSAPITVNNLLVGEILWAGTKGFVFSLSVLIVIAAFGILPVGRTIVAPVVGLFTGCMFAAVSLFVTSFVKTINHFNFYFTGFLSPMFFFSGVVFPLENLPDVVRPIAEALPLTHSVRLVRTFALGDQLGLIHLYDVGYMVLFTAVFGYLAIRRLSRRMVD